MKVFISWSGEQSREIADLLRQWLPGVLQATKPYFSPDDINKGARWSTDLFSELNDCNVGLIVITPENQSSQWLMFEAGALAKSLADSRVAPLVFGMEMSELTGPLTHFQAAEFSKEEMRKVVRMLNNSLDERALASEILSTVFEMWWPKLEKDLKAVLEKISNKTPKAERSEKEIIEEILMLTRSAARNSDKAGAVGFDVFEHVIQILSSIPLGEPDALPKAIRELSKPLSYMAEKLLSPRDSRSFRRSYAELRELADARLHLIGTGSGLGGLLKESAE